MDIFIYREARFRKRLDQFYKAGGKEYQVAERVDRIIESLCRGKDSLGEFGKLTKYGEARVKKCTKLNLGSGHRLLYLKDRDRFVFLFFGTHDECDRWLTHNTGFEAFETGTFSRVFTDQDEGSRPQAQESPAEDEDDYDVSLTEKVDDKTLRWVFRGLVRQQADGPEHG
jgi:hypothetical protein